MLLADVVATSVAVSATRSRSAKASMLAALLGRTAAESPEDIATVTSYLAGALRQRRTGLGWRSLQDVPPPAAAPSLTVSQVHESFEQLAALAGTGSQQARRAATTRLMAQATADEQRWLRGIVTGEVRQGALDSLVQDALAIAGGVPAASVRRAAMMAGSTVDIAPAALTGGEEALAAFTLAVGRPVLPMLASTAPTIEAAMTKAGGGVVAVDTKLDGVRIQVHRNGDDVRVVTRSLDDVTSRHPEVVAAARALACDTVVLDGEVLALGPDGRPRPFQETASRAASATGVELTPAFFDLLHLDGRDLVDAPTSERLAALESVVPERFRVRRLLTSDVAAAEAFAESVLGLGHEGVVVKSLAAPYAAGRRGATWVKVKPVHTLDLVVLAVERGSGRRSGWLSNIHLGARDGDGFVMLGKTFKGMTDEMLARQTERFRELQVADDGYVVTVRPEQVVEVAFDGVQRSTRYPGGVALRFARVVRYRDDKTPAEADTLDTVRGYLGPSEPAGDAS
ncbi:ATP-dependent DNA ligase [Aeromicrobium wangtongii]|uniref:Probable DNA ligase n=1 Tax=Aeromicrobium wangtongii TaxID=2969247 RepID=A0ABY5M6X9_9ACTN|nr:ATP-dependent DNA ligase [Aeromicrobium wangtongii]MCD9199243.1 ATP-dependent DNA ligase [Aeromicrobium wangtongii]UUP12730.1 ATP-dependent DNA ligase [Aeromicrobium wangtongii]